MGKSLSKSRFLLYSIPIRYYKTKRGVRADMLKYLAKRVGRSILTLFIIVTLVFCLLRLMPVEGYFANYEKMTEVQIQAGLQSMGLLFDASNWKYWVLPVCSMSLGNIAFYAMWLRRYMVDESNKDYVRLARAKGVSENKIALKHIFRNAMVPLVQYIPSAFLNTVVGSIYIESLYSIPGMGGLLVTCVQRHDNTMVQGIVLLYACVGIIGLILGDLLMVLIDPRISLGKKEGGR